MFCASILKTLREDRPVRSEFGGETHGLRVVWFLILLIVCGVPASHAQSRGDRRGRLQDYFGRRSEFRIPFNTPSPLDPVNMMWFRTIDGSMNNVLNWQWGQAGETLQRRFPAAYSDGVSSPAGSDRLSARVISNIVLAQDESIPNRAGLTSMVWQWGQFLDHDIDLTETATPPEQFLIDVPAGDEWFDPLESGNQQIALFRSEYEIDSAGSRQQVNSITSWIDGSNIYGSDETTAANLRAFSGGLLLESEGGLLPVGDDGFFLAGDVRANEQIGLTAMHTLLMREHNQVARRLAERRPELTDEELFLRARREVIATIHSITYNEFLPALLGPRGIAPYRGYDSDVNPDIVNVFSTAAYRFGHTMLNSDLLRLTNDASVAAEGNIALKDAFFNPDEIKDHGIDSLIKGLTVQTAQEIDTKIIDDVRNFLFGDPGQGGFDLASLNIQRGRDHGLPDLNTIRVAVGLPAHVSFEDVTSDAAVQAALSEAFDSVDNIDAWVGMLAEDHAPGSNLGSTAHTIVAQQFEDLRDADRFWYQRNLRGRELERIENTTLKDVIERNTSVRNLPDNVFTASRRSQPRRSRERNAQRESSSLSEFANWSQFLLPGWLNAFDSLGRLF